MKEQKTVAFEVSENGTLFVVTRASIVNNDGEVTHPGVPHRAPYLPHQDIADIENSIGKKLAAVVWTPEIVKAAKAKEAARLAAIEAEEEEQRQAIAKLVRKK